MRLRRAILNKVFKTSTVEGMFSDSKNKYYASATAAAITPDRKGQIMYGDSGGTKKVYLAKVGKATGSTATKANAWLDISNA